MPASSPVLKRSAWNFSADKATLKRLCKSLELATPTSMMSVPIAKAISRRRLRESGAQSSRIAAQEKRATV